MHAVRGVYDGKTLKLDESVRLAKPAEVVLTFLSGTEFVGDSIVESDQIALLAKGFDLGGIVYSSREQLYDRYSA